MGDFNADGAQDLAVANGFATSVSVLLGNGDGTFVAAGSFGVGDAPASVAVGDFNGDGGLDLAVANYSSLPFSYSPSSVSVLINPRVANPPRAANPTFSVPGKFSGTCSQPSSARAGI